MAEDIAPGLLAQIQGIFQSLCNRDKQLARQLAAIRRGSADYEGANAYAVRLGENLAAAFRRVFDAAELPDGQLYYNIAASTIAPVLSDVQGMIADVTEIAQEKLNQSAGIGMKPIRPALNEDRVSGFIDGVTSAPYERVAWKLKEPVVTFSQLVVCDAIKENAGFQARSGLSPKIRRTVVNNCCDWCRSVAGTYDYDEAPEGIYRRHNRCRCTVTYEPGDGRRQNAHTKRWEDSSAEQIEARKSIGLTSGYDKAQYPINPATGERYIDHKLVITDEQFGKKVGKHAVDFGLDPGSATARAHIKEIIDDVTANADERVYGEWSGQKTPVLFHVKGKDVVIESRDGEFVTVMRGAADHERIVHARERQI